MANAAVAEAAPVFAALGDETRLRLLARLGDGRPLSISALAAGEPMTRQAVTRHLRVLETAGLVRGEKSGREQRWELQSERLEDAKDWLETLSRRWDERLDRLRAFVEED
jgi:DNA-binding transcriptional ArsR family regulator